MQSFDHDPLTTTSNWETFLEAFVISGRFKKSQLGRNDNFKPVTSEELLELLEASNFEQTISDEVITDEKLGQLMDRSGVNEKWEQMKLESRGKKQILPRTFQMLKQMLEKVYFQEEPFVYFYV